MPGVASIDSCFHRNFWKNVGYVMRRGFIKGQVISTSLD